MSFFSQVNSGKINQLSASLAEIAQLVGVKVEDFPRLAVEIEDSGRIQRAINSVASPLVKLTVIFAGQEYDLANTVNIPTSVNVSLVSTNGSLIKTTSSNPAFSHTSYGRLEVSGFKFTGAGIGIKINTVENGSEMYHFYIEKCQFIMNSGVYGISLTGGREGIITKCYFETGYGIYRTQTTNTQITQCIFKNCGIGIFDDGDNTPYSDGLVMDKLIMLGCGQAIIEQFTDFFSLTNSMVDYNDQPLQIYGQLNGIVDNCYLSSRTNNPVIAIGLGTKYTGVTNQGLKFTNNMLVCHATSGTANCVELDSATNIIFENNDLTFYLTYGIKYSNTVNLKLLNNNISPRSSFGTNSIYCSAVDDSSNMAQMNNLTQLPSTQFMQFFNNKGYVNELKGQITLASGTTSIVVNHGLAAQPKYVFVTAQGGSSSGMGTLYTSNYTATQFTINVTTAPSGNITMNWRASF